MDFANLIYKSDPHQRTIVHLDMDCFYAQVEEIRDPKLRTTPLGIQQKNFVVTCNYVARKFGVRKLMSVPEAQKLCPTLVLISGEDLTPYRHMSQRIFDLLLNYTPVVEKLGLDENYLDVTLLVERRIQEWQLRQGNGGGDNHALEIVGHIYPPEGDELKDCDCGCKQRLIFGTQIAQEIRQDLHQQLGVTCCAGVSYNKLLAKLVGAQNKPNQQTMLMSKYAEEFMRELNCLQRVTGIGQKTASLLMESGISTIDELQKCDMEFLRKKCGFETASKLKDISHGRDVSAVRPSGKPKCIGLEDSCRPISVRTDVEERFRLLLMRLMEQVAEDGRIPVAIKVILRKFDPQKKTSHRETKQANILPSLFKALPTTDESSTKIMLTEGANEKLLKIIMRLFERIVDLSKPFNITLIGLAFSKFQQRKVGPSSIANFLIKKSDLEVQSITSLTNTSLETSAASPTPSVSSINSDEGFRSSPTTFKPSDQFYRRRTGTASPVPMLIDNGSESAATNSDFSDFSETEVEPSPKKSRISRLLLAKRRCLVGTGMYQTDTADVASPSKLRVCDLRLNSRDSEKDFPMAVSNPLHIIAGNITTSTGAASLAFQQCVRTSQPPTTLLSRVDRLDSSRSFFKRQFSSTPSSAASSPLPSPMDESGSSVAITPLSPPALYTSEFAAAACAAEFTLTNNTGVQEPSVAAATATTSESTTDVPTTTTTITGNLSNIPYPADVDPQVFNALPVEVQNELIASWHHSLVATVNENKQPSTNIETSVAANVPQVGNTTASAKATAVTTTRGNSAQKNTLYHYFLRNK